MSLLIAACGDGGDDGSLSVEAPVEGTTTATGTPSCADSHHVVVFSVFGTATTGEADETTQWIEDSTAEPVARPGAADVVTTYRELGYEILYLTSLSSGTRIGDQPLVDAITVWLGTNGFPVGDAVQVWAWDGEGEASVAVIEELARLSGTGVNVDAAYASDTELVFPLITGGIPNERLFTVGPAAGDDRSAPLPADDMEAHLPQVQALEPVCE